MVATNEKQELSMVEALAPATPLQTEVQPPLYSPVRETKTDPKITSLLPPLQTHGLAESASSSATAVNPAQASEPIVAQPTAQAPPISKSTPTSTSSQSTYDAWNPADASNKDGRPYWWNRWFCCGYGVGCVLCLCGSPTCWQERQKQVKVDSGEGEKEVKQLF